MHIVEMRDLITTPMMQHLVKSDLSQLHPHAYLLSLFLSLILGLWGLVRMARAKNSAKNRNGSLDSRAGGFTQLRNL